MRDNLWSCGALAGIVATLVLTAISMTLFLLNLIPLSITEYAARFILHLDGKEMNVWRWVIGFLTNFSLGTFFGIVSAYLYKVTGFHDKWVKIGAIGVGSWFFHLALVPFLDPEMSKHSKIAIAIPYYFFYLIWAVIATLLISKYLYIPEADQ